MGRLMAIEGRKNAQDARRGKIFTKVVRELSVAARAGGSDPKSNPRLRLAMDRGLAVNMPRDAMERAIKKAAGELEGVSYEEIRYEGYAPGGVAVIVDCMTDNKNRTASEIRHIFAKYGGNMGAAGSVAFQFSKKGYLAVEKSAAKEDALMELALEAGAEDFRSEDADVFEITTELSSFESVKAQIEGKGIVTQTAELQMMPSSTTAVGDKAPALLKLLDMLEDNDDVQKVWSNGDIEDEYLEA